MPSNNTWPDELVAIARSLYESGKHGTKQIAAIVGYGKTKNSIISIAHRRGWVNPNPKKGGTKPGDKKQRQVRQWKPRRYHDATPVGLPPEPMPPPDFLGLTIQELRPSSCRFPVGAGPEYKFCGQPVTVGSYCGFHDRICHEPPRARGQFVGRQKF